MTTRLHRLVLGATTLPPVQDVVFEQIQILAPAMNTLNIHLNNSGTWRTGQLYGRVTDDYLVITHAAIGGYPLWRPQPLTGTVPYQLGYLDGLRACGHTDIDWVGHWVMRPDSRLPTQTDSTNWWRYGAPRGLFSAERILLSVGLLDDRLAAEGYHEIDGRMETLPVMLASG